MQSYDKKLGSVHAMPYRLDVVAAADPRADVAPSVLIVDDDPEVCAYLEDVFHIEGFEVATVCDPTVVVELLRDETFHLLVVDVMMPKIDGFELLAQIRTVDEHVPVIMVTSGGSQMSDPASMALGVSDYLVHPITPFEVRHAVSRTVKERPGS
jgi:DNA-binding response OmpR family regulator